MYTYLLINIGIILFPLLLSFDKRVHYVSRWKYLFPSLFLVGIIFFLWDHYFTEWGIWGFNPAYLLGIYLWQLPLEEILFFVCVPFACLFIYEVVRYYNKRDVLQPVARPVTILLICILFLVGLGNLQRTYTAVNFIALAMLLGVHLCFLKSGYLGHFYLAYLLSFIPFSVANGILTNGLRFIDQGPVVWYNDMENLSLRIIGIPIEDFFYSMFLFLFNVTFYEHFKKKYSAREKLKK